MKDKTKELRITWISCVAAIASAVCAFLSRRSTQSANTISDRLLQIEENRKLNENKEKSLDYVNSLYNKIMYTPELYEIYLKIQKWNLIWNEDFLYRFINEFEWLGSKYCQEQIYLVDLKSINWLLKNVCTNSTINNIIEKSSRNTFSKICLDVVWENWIWKYFNWKDDCKVLH